MIARAAALAAGTLLLLGSPARAALSRFDPLHPYGAELAGGVLLSSSLSGPGSSATVGVGRVLLLAPVGRELQAGAGLWLDGTRSRAVVGGLRRLATHERWRTRLDAQVLLELLPSVNAGLRLGVGLSYEVLPRWHVGLAVGLGALAPEARTVADAVADISVSF